MKHALVLALLLPASAGADTDGGAVWQGTCRDCHANPLSDAPQVKDAVAWEARLAKGRQALYASALGGYSGPSGSEMPPRGGNPALSDADVRAAVDHMISLVTHERKQP